MKIIANHSILSSNYSEMLIQKRIHDKAIEDGTARCLHCKRKKVDHLPDSRCSVNALSRVFAYEHAERLHKINKAIVLLEELMEL